MFSDPFHSQGAWKSRTFPGRAIFSVFNARFPHNPFHFNSSIPFFLRFCYPHRMFFSLTPASCIVVLVYRLFFLQQILFPQQTSTTAFSFSFSSKQLRFRQLRLLYEHGSKSDWFKMRAKSGGTNQN